MVENGEFREFFGRSVEKWGICGLKHPKKQVSFGHRALGWVCTTKKGKRGGNGGKWGKLGEGGGGGWGGNWEKMGRKCGENGG